MQEEAVDLASPFSFEDTLARVKGAIEDAGLTIFAHIDHAGNARKAGLEMPSSTVLIYGNALGGTPAMQSAPLAALDLPLRVLVRAEGSGAVIAFHPIAPVLLRAGVPEALAQRLQGAQHLLAKAVQP